MSMKVSLFSDKWMNSRRYNEIKGKSHSGNSHALPRINEGCVQTHPYLSDTHALKRATGIYTNLGQPDLCIDAFKIKQPRIN